MVPAINALSDNRLAAAVSRDRGRADASYAHAGTMVQEQAATSANEIHPVRRVSERAEPSKKYGGRART